jgi:hypothetical protein
MSLEIGESVRVFVLIMNGRVAVVPLQARHCEHLRGRWAGPSCVTDLEAWRGLDVWTALFAWVRRAPRAAGTASRPDPWRSPSLGDHAIHGGPALSRLRARPGRRSVRPAWHPSWSAMPARLGGRGNSRSLTRQRPGPLTGAGGANKRRRKGRTMTSTARADRPADAGRSLPRAAVPPRARRRTVEALAAASRPCPRARGPFSRRGDRRTRPASCGAYLPT